MSSISVGRRLAVVNVIYDICVTSFLVQAWQNTMSFIMLTLVAIEAVLLFVCWEGETKIIFVPVGKVFSSFVDLFPFIFAFQGAEDGGCGVYEQTHTWTLVLSFCMLFCVALYECYTFVQLVTAVKEDEDLPEESRTTLLACVLRLVGLYLLIVFTIWGEVTAVFWVCLYLPVILVVAARLLYFCCTDPDSDARSPENQSRFSLRLYCAGGFCFLMTTIFNAGYHAVFIGNKFTALNRDTIAPEDLCSPSIYYFYCVVVASMFIYTCLLYTGILYQIILILKRADASNESSVAAV